MTKTLPMLALALAFALASTTAARAQDKPAPSPAPAAKASSPSPTPLKIQIVISRSQGEKKISSLPYTLSVNAGVTNSNRASLRMGAQVPVMTMAAGPIQYKDVGTNIDCDALVLDDGRFRLQLNVDDSSVYPDEQKNFLTSGSPSFRSFRATDSMVLKDGGTAQFTAAIDKVSGETVRVDVTLTVVK